MANQPKFVFFGTPEFAAIILEKLIAGGFVPVALVCNPDRPVGRKKIITAPPTKELAIKHGAQNIKVLQPEKLDNDFKFQISEIKPEFAIVAAYAKIIPKEIIDLFPRGIIGIHPSLLPKYRGTSPIQSAILNGEKESGVTLYLIDELVDHGPILAQEKSEDSVSELQFSDLLKKLAVLGRKLIIKTLPDFVSDKVNLRAQDETEATYTKKFKTDDAFVPPEKLRSAVSGEDKKIAEEIDRKIRALNPEPGAWTTENGKRLKLIQSKIKEGRLMLVTTQKEGEKPRSV